MAQVVAITCASGKQGAHVIPRLYEDPKYTLMLIVNRAESAQKLRDSYPRAEVTQADLVQPNECIRVVSGASTVLHIGPSCHPHETAIGYNMIDACLASLAKTGVSVQFVYSSVLRTQLRTLMNHDCKRYVEEHLIESSLPWTILNPTRFMEMFPLPLLMRQYQKGNQPVVEALYNSELPQSSISLADLGDACVKIVKEREKHFHAQYPVYSTTPESFAQMVAVCEKQISTKIDVVKLSREQADDRLLGVLYGSPEKAPLPSREGVSRMLLHYEDRGLQGSPNVLRWLLGREPFTFEQWAISVIGRLREDAHSRSVKDQEIAGPCQAIKPRSVRSLSGSSLGIRVGMEIL